MSRGIVTIATGQERYYLMARNLLHSIRVVSPGERVAVITDKDNPYINEFDDAIILSYPYKSYLDKIDLLISAPYSENIFLDADSLVYKPIEYLWDLFSPGTDFSYLGEAMPMDSDKGFFTSQITEKWPYDIHYIPRLHGGLYFVRPGEYCTEMWRLCMQIKENYSSLEFKIFSQPADEPILALAAATMGATVVENINDICFLPVIQSISADFLSGKLEYIQDDTHFLGAILHFSNHNTEKAFYKNEIDKVQHLLQKKHFSLVPTGGTA